MIKNRVKESGVITLDLMSFCNTGPRKTIDLVDWLESGLIIKESSFKSRLKSMNIDSFSGALVNIFCSSDAIIPTWAYLLLQTKIQGVAKDVFFGNDPSFELYLFQKNIKSLNIEKYKNKIVFIKSCQNKLLPIAAFSIISGLLLPQVKSLFYGEPCSSVPLIKN
tara:strand:+ start:2222 stop:2716 length:495 start_codon:yes stop_codon:yes gene_type:complete